MKENIPDDIIAGHHVHDRFYFGTSDVTILPEKSSIELANEMAAKMGQNDADDFMARYYNE